VKAAKPPGQASTGPMPELDIAFSPNGQHLAVRQPAGRGVFYYLPERIGEGPLRIVRRFEKGNRPILGMASAGRKRFVVLTAGDDGRVYINRHGMWLRPAAPVRWLKAPADGTGGVPVEEAAGVPGNRPLLAPDRMHRCVLMSQHGQEWMFLLDAAHWLWRYDLSDPGEPPRLLRSDLEMPMESNDELCGLSHSGLLDQGWTVFSVPTNSRDAIGLPLASGLHREIKAGARVQWFGMLGNWRAWVLCDGTQWHIGTFHHATGTPKAASMPVRESMHVLGVTMRADGSMQLLAYADTRLCLLRSNGGEPELLRAFGAPIARAQYHSQSERIALVDERGMLTIYSMRTRGVLATQNLYGMGGGDG